MAIVRYLVHDVDAAVEFYALLGFALEARWGTPFAIVKRADLQLWLSGPGTSASRPLQDGSRPAPGGWNRLVVECAELPQMMAVLRAAGVRFRSEPITGPGGTQLVVDDPSGNAVELFQPAAAR
jgi:catechol 2,3-dioxygenase-like lactoylglutathione lyase family enzyme